MDGRSLAGSILGELRRRNGLSQRALAEVSAVPQPTLSEIEGGRREPSISLLSRIAESVGSTLEVRLVPLDRFSAVATANAIKQRLSDNDGENRALEERSDGALRAILDFREALRRSSSEQEFLALSQSPPDLTGHRGWDALLAAVVEDESARRRVSPPRWTNESRRFVKPFWHLSDIPDFRYWELRTAPASFLRHGVLANDEELASI
jgi:transcriptional regulator with XRE-family HTH domain